MWYLQLRPDHIQVTHLHDDDFKFEIKTVDDYVEFGDIMREHDSFSVMFASSMNHPWEVTNNHDVVEMANQFTGNQFENNSKIFDGWA